MCLNWLLVKIGAHASTPVEAVTADRPIVSFLGDLNLGQPAQRLQAPLKGSDWVQAANADKLYSAVDLMELAAGTDGVVYVAHDARLPRPDWLRRQFKPTELGLTVNGQKMSVFGRRVRNGESLTLGSNTEDRRLKSSNMYIVFMNRDDLAYRASRENASR